MKNGLLIFALIICSISLEASTLVEDTMSNKRLALLQLIDSHQISDQSSILYGAFPSVRKYFYSKKHKEEDNVFFTALVVFNIGQFEKEMSLEEQMLYRKIKSNALPYISRFKNKKNDLTFNFWPRNPPQIFPNGGWLNKFNKQFALADDIDDSAITLLALDGSDSLAKAMQAKFLEYRVGVYKKNKSFYRRFHTRPVYSTWLGHKMPKDVDVSVLSNVVLMHTLKKLPLNATDTASLDLIVDLIKSSKHLNDPKMVSQHYAQTSTILYHLARLIYASDYAPLLRLRPILLEQSIGLYKKSKTPLEQLLLNTAILRLGGEASLYKDINEQTLKQNDYPYFVANIASVLNNPLKRWINASNLVRFDYYSYAFNLSLLYENWMLRSLTSKGLPPVGR